MKSLKADSAATQKDSSQVAGLIAATGHSLPEQPRALERARALAEPLIGDQLLDTGENTLDHAQAVAEILQMIGGSEAMQAAS